jgi:integrase
VFKSKRKDGIRYGGAIIYPTDTESFFVDFNRDGDRIRKACDTLDEAKRFIDKKRAEFRDIGRQALNLSDRDRLDLAEFRGVDQVTRLADVFTFWTRHHPAGEVLTVEALVADFLAAETGRRGKKIVKRREATTTGHRKRLRLFRDVFGPRPVHEMTRQDVEQWLDANGWTGLNRRHYLAAARALFNHAVRRGAVAMNPAEAVELPAADPVAPVIMTPAAVKAYLAAIAKKEPDLLAREALAFFCGLRPEELSRLDWRNVSLENRLVTIEGDVAKVQGHRRHVEIPDNLAAWIATRAQEAGKVWPYASPTTLSRKRAAARKAGKVTVPDNAGRHAFASYHLALHENAPKTAEALGHADVDLLKNVYRNITAADGRPITKAAAVEYFNIRPKAAGKIIQLRAAG